ncbi:MAG TPA: ATP phosphoribosyltransferase [Trueperaceae bacterium]
MSDLVLALPKGRMLDHALKALADAGVRVEVPADPRALRYPGDGVSVLVMRNADVPTYVDLGVADAGMVGHDVLLETGSRLYAPVDLGFGACRLSLIRPQGARGPVGRVATKYPRLTAEYLRRTGSPAEVIALEGNVELACLSGLADAVVDVVQTGATLAANDLVEVHVIALSTVRFVVNRAALKLKSSALRPLIVELREVAGRSA